MYKVTSRLMKVCQYVSSHQTTLTFDKKKKKTKDNQFVENI